MMVLTDMLPCRRVDTLVSEQDYCLSDTVLGEMVVITNSVFLSSLLYNLPINSFSIFNSVST
jgi:hypothetical protein